MEWQPIGTAPKDDRILVYNPFMGVYSTRYLDGEWPCVMPHASASNLSETPPRWDIDDPEKKARIGVWYPSPTHWMPLPASPAVTPKPPRVDAVQMRQQVDENLRQSKA